VEWQFFVNLAALKVTRLTARLKNWLDVFIKIRCCTCLRGSKSRRANAVIKRAQGKTDSRNQKQTHRQDQQAGAHAAMLQQSANDRNVLRCFGNLASRTRFEACDFVAS